MLGEQELRALLRVASRKSTPSSSIHFCSKALARENKNDIEWDTVLPSITVTEFLLSWILEKSWFGGVPGV